jgi:eukaryotic-like serine/threonine-protein kinase
MALEVGQRVGDYEILALLGAGGMGRVYKVRNIISNREEAMKILLPDYASEPELAARFMTEIRTLAGLEHPNIAQLRTAFQSQNQFVMVMEFVEGTTLDTLASKAPIPLDQVLEYSTQVLSALSYAHSRGVTHRDIKPANIMITSHGLIKLMDFGIAKSTNDMQLTRPGTTMGSVYYMSPEQVRGGTVDARSDIYSFGVTLYEMLTGRRPFQANTSYSVLNAQLNEAPTPPALVNPALSQELNDIVLRAMVKHPNGRFQTADEFRNALKNLREPIRTQFVPQTSPYPQGQSAKTALESGGYTPGPMQTPAQAAPYISPPSAGTGKSHRGLWIGLGAFTAILALVASATLLPHVFKTNASQKPTMTATDAQTPAPQPAAGSTAQTSAPAEQPNPLSTATPQNDSAASLSGEQPDAGSGSPNVPAEKPQKGTARRPVSSAASSVRPAFGMVGAPNASGRTGSAAVPAVTAGPSAQEIREAHDRYSNLEARADAASSGVQQLRSQQQAQGFDIRGDILGSLNRMNSSMSEASRALGQNNLQAANDYMDRADKELSTLEQFLNIK